MKVALFKNIEPGYLNGLETVHKADFDMSGYVRTSETVDVEFPPLQDEKVIQGHLRALDDAEQNIRNKFQQALDQISTQRASLQALTYVPA